jgi:hypothetical protein
MSKFFKSVTFFMQVLLWSIFFYVQLYGDKRQVLNLGNERWTPSWMWLRVLVFTDLNRIPVGC